MGRDLPDQCQTGSHAPDDGQTTRRPAAVCGAGAKLTAIDQFRQEKEASEMERAELEQKLAQVHQQHADYVYETDKKRVIEMHKYYCVDSRCFYVYMCSLICVLSAAPLDPSP